MTTRDDLHDPNAERALVGAPLVDSTVLPLPVLEDDFYLESCRLAYGAEMALHASGQPIDTLTLEAELTRRGQWDKTGLLFIMQCERELPSASNAVGYADIVRRFAQRRSAVDIGSNIVKSAFSGNGSFLSEVERARAELGAIIPPDENRNPSPEEIPALPQSARLDPELGKGAGWPVDLYLTHASAISPMTPESFHLSSALWLCAVLIARRLKIAMPFGDVYPNLYILWLALTTLWRKTTALDIPGRIARSTFGHLVAPQDTTPEALLSDLSGAQPVNYTDMAENDRALWQSERNFSAQRGLIYDEMSGLLAQAGKDYNGGLIEAFLRFYDCDPRFVRSTRGQGRIVVSNSYLSILGASTPAALAPHMVSERLWSNGWWPRFALLTPDTDRPEWQTPTETQEPTDLIRVLRDLYAKLPAPTWPEPPEAKTVMLGTGVFEAWERYNRALSYELLTPDLDTKLWGTYGRLPVQALKVALILSALDWTTGNAPVVELPHLARAISIAESWRASAHRAMTMATQNQFSRLQARILRQLSLSEPTGATLRDLRRNIGDKSPDEISEVLRQLVDAGEVIEVGTQPGTSGGRKTTRFKIA